MHKGVFKMITTTITDDYEFANWIKNSGSYSNNFSVQGAKALQAYLEELSEDIGENIEFDPIAWCVEYSEYENFKELQDNYTEVENMEELLERTAVIPIEGTERFIIQDF